MICIFKYIFLKITLATLVKGKQEWEQREEQEAIMAVGVTDDSDLQMERNKGPRTLLGRRLNRLGQWRQEWGKEEAWVPPALGVGQAGWRYNVITEWRRWAGGKFALGPFTFISIKMIFKDMGLNEVTQQPKWGLKHNLKTWDERYWRNDLPIPISLFNDTLLGKLTSS